MAYTGSQAISGHGAQLLLGTGTSPYTYVLISEVGAITGPAFTGTVIDVSNMESAGWKESIPGMRTGGALSFEINWIPEDPTHSYSTGLLHFFAEGLACPLQLILPTTAPVTWTFLSIIKTFTPDIPLDGKLAVKVDVEITGQPTLA